MIRNEVSVNFPYSENFKLIEGRFCPERPQKKGTTNWDQRESITMKKKHSQNKLLKDIIEP